MEDALVALNTIEKNGVIGKYAIGGAIGASFYIEATATEDIDAFVFMQPAEGSLLLSLTPIYNALIALGGVVVEEHIQIGQWKIQILPAYNELVEDALNDAIEVEYAGIPTRVFTPEYTCAIALHTKRDKDFLRVGMFISQREVDLSLLKKYIVQYGLEEEIKNVANWVDPDETKPGNN